MNKKLLITSFLMALGEAFYIFIVSLFMFNIQRIFGQEPGILGFVSFLTLFVISVALTGALVLGKPILLYLEGKKGESIKLFFTTLGWLVVFLIIFLAILVV